MAFKFKKQSKAKKQHSYRKMFIYVLVINYPLIDQAVHLLQEYDSNAQCALIGKGTANKEVLSMLGIEDERKGVIMAFVDQNNIKQISQQLDKTFFSGKEHMGVGFSLPLTSIVGKKVYHFLTNTI